jgi:hypothetical protein
MKNNQLGMIKRFALATVAAAAIVAVSALAIRSPNNNPNLLARPFKSIQTDKVILFDGSSAPVLAPTHTTIQNPPITGESRAATEHFKSLAQPFLMAGSHVTVQNPPITGESRAATEHLKAVAKPFLMAGSNVVTHAPPITGESRAATEHLKLVAKAF